jgi:hypothetical protein
MYFRGNILIVHSIVVIQVDQVQGSTLCSQFWRRLLSDFSSNGGSAALEVIWVPVFVLMELIDGGIPLDMEDRSGYCRLFEEVFTG